MRIGMFHIISRLFKENDLQPSDINSIKDLNKLPLLNKQDIRENLHDMISNRFKKDDLIEYETSGSTGSPLPVYVDRDEDDYRKAKHLRSNIIVGQRPRDMYVCVTSPSHYGRVPSILRKFRIFSREFVSVFDDIETQLKKVQSYEPDILAGYSSSLYLLAQEAEKKNISDIKPKFILGGAELSDDHHADSSNPSSRRHSLTNTLSWRLRRLLGNVRNGMSIISTLTLLLWSSLTIMVRRFHQVKEGRLSARVYSTTLCHS